MTKTTPTILALALCCALGVAHAKTESATGAGNSEPEACKAAKDNAKRSLYTISDVRYSGCNCQKKDNSGFLNWVCEVEARTVEK